MQISKLTFIGFYLNGALGSGKYDDISIGEVKEKIRKHVIFDYLQDTLNDDIDLSFLTPEDKRELNKDWKTLIDTVDEAKRMRVHKNGLCLLVAYVFEGIRARAMEAAEQRDPE